MNFFLLSPLPLTFSYPFYPFCYFCPMSNLTLPSILFIPRWYPSRFDPMLGLFTQRHAEIIANNADITVLFIHPFPNADKKFTPEINTENNITVIRILFSNPTSSSFISRIKKVVNLFKAYYIGIKTIKNLNRLPNLSHIHVLSRTAIPALYLYFFYKTPFIVTEHWSRYMINSGQLNNYFHKLFIQFTLNRSQHLTAVSQFLLNTIAQKGFSCKRTSILPNVVDTTTFSIQPKTSSKKTIIHISTFEDRSKNLKGMLNAIYQLKLKLTSFELIMVGDGEDFSMIKNYAAQLDLTDIITFKGMIADKKEVADLITQSDLLLLFSRYETMSVVAAEALACGIPVVATKMGALPEIVLSNFGILVDNENETQLCDAIYKVLTQPELFNKNQMREFAITNFSEEAIRERLLDLYNKYLRR